MNAMRYFPHTEDDIRQMLETVGAESIDALFSGVPPDCRADGAMHLSDPLCEWDLDRTMSDLSKQNAVWPELRLFVGAGRYAHHIPAVVPALANRSEFLTAYTPYQPEISQGTLQAIYEYQTMAARLMGVDVVTASHYDGATALAESLLMAIRKTGRTRVVVSRAIHPHFRQVIRTYLKPAGYPITEAGFTSEGITDLSGIDLADAAALAVQSPNFFGCIEPLSRCATAAHDAGALLVASFTEAMSLGILKSPGSQGADIVAGEGQSFGLPMGFGGPGLGMLGARQELVRTLPGRLIGKTKDRNGKPGFVLTLATREQHIRREKATSNICSNNGHCALTAAIYLASVGSAGLARLARTNHNKAAYLAGILETIGMPRAFSAPFFNEFVIQAQPSFASLRQRLLQKGFLAGLPLESHYPELKDHYLFCATETISRWDMDQLIVEVRS
jgi:glycine dehydrogenase subunit 1